MSDESTFASEGPNDAGTLALSRAAALVQPIFREIKNGPLPQMADLELLVSIELGRVSISLPEMFQLTPGSLLQLDKNAGDLLDIVINEQLVAQGELVILDGKYAIRVVRVMPAQSARE